MPSPEASAVQNFGLEILLRNAQLVSPAQVKLGYCLQKLVWGGACITRPANRAGSLEKPKRGSHPGSLCALPSSREEVSFGLLFQTFLTLSFKMEILPGSTKGPCGDPEVCAVLAFG